jgi:ABC-type glycerol-3-phosphate transport system permease component
MGLRTMRAADLSTGIVNSLQVWGLFVAFLTFALPFSTWVMVTYLRGLPRELEEAALICAAPVVLLYLVLQRYLVGGLTAGGVK